MITDLRTHRIGRCEIELRDGRVIDLTGKTVEECVLMLLEQNIKVEDVRETRHYVKLPPTKES